MPELPEIEHLQRTLRPLLVGARVESVRLYRMDVWRNRADESSQYADRLLRGQRIVRLLRHGKQLALIGDHGGVVCVHLGMSGQLLHLTHRARIERPDHVHCIWRIRNDAVPGRLLFRDPRRFGGLWTFNDEQKLRQQRWARLGPDALKVTSEAFQKRLRATRRPVKSALLDQGVIAGVGNIYADEALFRAGIAPSTPACLMGRPQTDRLLSALKATLRTSVSVGGSTFRDYRDANGQAGAFGNGHLVYNRAGQPCTTCGTLLKRILIAQRSTTFCPQCQR